MKLITAIYDQDDLYLSKVAEHFKTNYAKQLELHCFTQLQAALDFLRNNLAHVFLSADEGLSLELVPERSAFAFLTDSALVEEIQGRRAVQKYQKLDFIYSEIRDLYREKLGNVINFTEGSAAVLMFTSPTGGVGCSVVSAACAMHFARLGKKVLHLCLEPFGNSGTIFSAGGDQTFYHALFAVKNAVRHNKRGNLASKLEKAKRDDGATGVAFFEAMENTLDMQDMDTEVTEVLLGALKSDGGFDVIIVDMPMNYQPACLAMLRLATRVFLVSDGKRVSHEKLGRAIAAMQELQERKSENYYDKLTILYNNLDSEGGSYRDYDDIPRAGQIQHMQKEYTDQTALARDISALRLFESLLTNMEV